MKRYSTWVVRTRRGCLAVGIVLMAVLAGSSAGASRLERSVGAATGGSRSDDATPIAKPPLKINPGGISIEIYWAAHWDGSTVELEVDKLINHRSTHSGTLRLELWASPTFYTGGTIQGYKIAEKELGSLAPGEYYEYLDYFVPQFTSPPLGS